MSESFTINGIEYSIDEYDYVTGNYEDGPETVHIEDIDQNSLLYATADAVSAFMNTLNIQN